MIVLCAWCEQFGTRNVLSESPPLKSGSGHQRSASHGICGRHQREVLLEIYGLSRANRHGGGRDGRMPAPGDASMAASDLALA